MSASFHEDIKNTPHSSALFYGAFYVRLLSDAVPDVPGTKWKRSPPIKRGAHKKVSKPNFFFSADTKKNLSGLRDARESNESEQGQLGRRT